MTNWDKTLNSGVLYKDFGRYVTPFELPKKSFEWLKEECFNQKGKIPNNENLIGHIKEEYKMTNIDYDFQNFIIKASFTGVTNKWMSKYSFLTEDRPIVFESMWCNFQRKYEFNPPHTHSGLLSFVVFVKIPYDLEEEHKVYPDVKTNPTIPIATSKFCFLNPNGTGISMDVINVDKSFEGKGFIFPSTQYHEVYPFYTSDDYRITVSGNLRYKV